MDVPDVRSPAIVQGFTQDLVAAGKNWAFPDVKQAGKCELLLEFKQTGAKKPDGKAPPNRPPDMHMFEMAPRAPGEP